MAAAAVPLAPVDLKVPHQAPVQDKRAGLLVFVPPGGGGLINACVVTFYFYLPVKCGLKLYLPSSVRMCGSVSE